jgi:hypothetical protein
VEFLPQACRQERDVTMQAASRLKKKTAVGDTTDAYFNLFYLLI